MRRGMGMMSIASSMWTSVSCQHFFHAVPSAACSRQRLGADMDDHVFLFCLIAKGEVSSLFHITAIKASQLNLC